MKKAKLPKDIKGFDDVGIGVIWFDEGKGTYILCKDLAGYDLSGVQIYRYNNMFREMRPVDSIGEDSRAFAYCVKRADLG